jgi:dienelactone hydrolase
VGRSSAIVALCVALSALLASSVNGDEPDLKRRAFFGTQLSAVQDPTRERLKLAAGEGVEVNQVFPDSSALDAGLQAGDVLLTYDGTKITSPAQFVEAIRGKKAGEALVVDYLHDGTRFSKKLTLKAYPRETSDEFEVLYGSVVSHQARLRTIVTKPKSSGKHPALFIIQGVGVFSVDNPIGVLECYKTIARDFTNRGYVTLRVDKPGCGDSEGGPTRDVDFDTELDGYRQALKLLKASADVDPEKVFIFGHSMGGVMAPLLATEIPVKGIVVYGTLSKTWHEYMLENFRRQSELADTDPAEVDRRMRDDAAIMNLLYRESMTPKVIADKYPDLADRIKQMYPDSNYFADRSLGFFRQLAAKNLGEAWKSYGGHVLAMWGKADFVSSEDDHARIAAIVNREHPGHGTFLALDGVDHGFLSASTQRDSMNRQGAGEFNALGVDSMRSWIAKLAQDTK